ncbi:MAG: hypothetical protein LBE12_04385 [Planctomycetaceae bacterium]|nr:hypothetical protein [Planctomycetaceae bacterium]
MRNDYRLGSNPLATLSTIHYPLQYVALSGRWGGRGILNPPRWGGL